MIQQLWWFLPEIIVLASGCLVLLMPRAWAWPLSWLGLAMAMIAIAVTAPEQPVQLFSGAFERAVALDPLRLLICGLTFLVLQYGRGYQAGAERLQSNEFYSLALFGTVGMLLISGGQHLIVLYLGLEILALSLYPMVTLTRDDGRAAEAAIKYFVLGSIASALLLYGISLVYAATGTLMIDEWSIRLAAVPADRLMLLGLVFMLAGAVFKLGAVPFHMWLPDVYDGASLPSATYLSAAPKIVGLLLLMRLFSDGLGALSGDWTVLVLVLAVLSLLWGNLVAIMQTRIRRMLAYSAIAHTGFMLLALGAGSTQGMSAAIFYSAIYALMAAGCFGMLMLLNARMEVEEISDFKGLNQTHPWLALLMLLLMFSMAGVPLTAGFYAKLYVLKTLIAVDYWWLAVLAVVLTVVGAYYYLRVIWYMYFESPQREMDFGSGSLHRFLLSINVLALVAVFVFPQPWLALSRAAAQLFTPAL